MQRSQLLAFLTFATALLLWQSPADAGNKSVDQVKGKATATKPDDKGRQTVTITLDIAKGWHIYANPVGNELLEPGQTKVKIVSKVKLKDVDVAYPKGKLVVDGKEKYSIYEDRITIQAAIARAPGDTGPLEISIAVQACTDKTCLQPGTLKFSVP